MSDTQNSAGGPSLLTGWTLASSIGWAAGLTSGIWLTHLATNLPWLNEDHFFGYATLISLGFTLGIAQGAVLRRCLPHPVHWVTATLSGGRLVWTHHFGHCLRLGPALTRCLAGSFSHPQRRPDCRPGRIVPGNGLSSIVRAADELLLALGLQTAQVLRSRDYLVVVERAEEVRCLSKGGFLF